MKNFTSVMICLILLIFSSQVYAKIRDTRDIILARQKRVLFFAEGVNWVQMVIGIGFPVELRHESVTWGATVKSWYLVPANTTDFVNHSSDISSRKTRSISRWKIYSTIKDFIERFKLGDGKICLMRSICEAALFPLDEKSGLLAEILTVLLKPSSTNEIVEQDSDFEYHAAERLGHQVNNCKILFPDCNFYSLEQISKLFL